MEEMSEALMAEASPRDLVACEPPRSTWALCLRREDERMFEGRAKAEIDVRESLRFEEVELPAIAPDEVLVGVMASAINHNTVWSACFQPVSTFRFLDQLSSAAGGERHHLNRHIVGSDGAGVVVRVGEAVRKWHVGDPVVIHPLYVDEQDPLAGSPGMLPSNQRAWGYETNFGGLAHYTVVKATQLLPKPAFLSWEEAGCNTLCLMTAYRMLISRNGSQVKLGDLVFIWGATGGLGAYATQLAKAAGCSVIGVVSSYGKAELASALGCDLVLNRAECGANEPNASGVSDIHRWMRERTRERFGADPDHVFEYSGRKTFGASVWLAKAGGTVVTCGSSTGYAHQYDNRYLWMKVKRIIGSHGGNYAEAAESASLVDRGIIAPALSRLFTLENAAAAASFVQNNCHVGKVGVLCLAAREGLGVSDRAARAKLSPERRQLFRQCQQAGLADDAV